MLKVTPLQKVVHETGAEIVRVKGEDAFLVDSPEYEKKKTWLIKGYWEVSELSSSILRKELRVERLEKDLTITINRPKIDVGEAKTEETADSSKPAETLQDGAQANAGAISEDEQREIDSQEQVAEEDALYKAANQIFTVRLVHKATGNATHALRIKRSEIPKFIDASIRKFGEAYKCTVATDEFLVVRVSFEDQTVDIDRC